ncbi:MAG: hypothetical protein LBI69_01485 [Puniceicoccales bacterium]|jgi:hypothetical protein|nr:hypothetical protein [Puniceicoccales bacterium]
MEDDVSISLRIDADIKKLGVIINIIGRISLGLTPISLLAIEIASTTLIISIIPAIVTFVVGVFVIPFFLTIGYEIYKKKIEENLKSIDGSMEKDLPLKDLD